MIEGRHSVVPLVFLWLTRNYCSLRADDDSLSAKDALNAVLLPDIEHYCEDHWSDLLLVIAIYAAISTSPNQILHIQIITDNNPIHIFTYFIERKNKYLNNILQFRFRIYLLHKKLRYNF